MTRVNKNDVKHVYVRYTVLAPILHGQPPAKGQKPNVMTNRTIKVSAASGGRRALVEIPVVSGNSMRGAGRRDYMRKILTILGYRNENGLITGLSGEAMALMTVGGTMEAGKKERARLAEGFLKVYQELPFVGFLGGVYKEVFFPGRLAVGFAVPVTVSTKLMLDRMKSPWANDVIPAADDAVADDTIVRFTRASAPPDFNIQLESWDAVEPIIGTDENLVQIIEQIQAEAEEKGLTRPSYAPVAQYLARQEATEVLQELANYFGVSLNDKKVVEQVVNKLKKLGEIRSIFAVQKVIPAGLELHSRISLVPGYGDDKMEIAFDAFVETVLSRGYLGGNIAKGYGAVAAEAKLHEGNDFATASRANEFWEWLEKDKKQIRSVLENLDHHLFGTKK